MVVRLRRVFYHRRITTTDLEKLFADLAVRREWHGDERTERRVGLFTTLSKSTTMNYWFFYYVLRDVLGLDKEAFELVLRYDGKSTAVLVTHRSRA